MIPRILLTSFISYDTGTTKLSRTAEECRFRLDNSSSNTFTLPDGRKLGYAQYGSLTGKPILYCHGLPGSRIEATYHDDLGKSIGARIIAIDRPGHGWSTPNPNRTLLGFVRDIERLAEHLELEFYSVMGVSGGGPSALACAFALPADKLKSVTIVVGLGPPDIGMRGARWQNYAGFTWGYLYFPTPCKWFFQREPSGRLDLTEEQRAELLLQAVSKPGAVPNEKDLVFLKDEDLLRMMMRSHSEAFTNGFDAVIQDGQLMCKDFGFRVEDIRPDLPVHLWYAEHDIYVPPNHGVVLKERLGERATLRMEDETHASIQVNFHEEILRELVEST
ncbi:alpha/beta-hydrolase [Tothia fuscella]|uniref:Alpha/beta-hydrolase n=1 Tax=Tothia fuscella TaxID=1048955 RepID=A0A9P4U1Z5_9PEZI|nr:alpha/beta-hydrolase [Tothia fuscella]